MGEQNQHGIAEIEDKVPNLGIPECLEDVPAVLRPVVLGGHGKAGRGDGLNEGVAVVVDGVRGDGPILDVDRVRHILGNRIKGALDEGVGQGEEEPLHPGGKPKLDDFDQAFPVDPHLLEAAVEVAGILQEKRKDDEQRGNAFGDDGRPCYASHVEAGEIHEDEIEQNIQ